MATLSSRIGMVCGARQKSAEGSLHSAARRAIIRRAGENRAAPVGMTKLAGGMTATSKGERNPRTGPAQRGTGHYRGRRTARLRRRPLHGTEKAGTMYRAHTSGSGRSYVGAKAPTP